MSKKKYDRYVLACETYADREYEDYRKAFHDYQKEKAQKTLYGVDCQGEYHVVFSK